MRFRGESFHTIDSKGRIIVPSRFREPVRASGTDALMISRLDGSLVVFPLPKWRSIENHILSLKETNESTRRLKRIFIGGAFQCPCDRQDRILVPPSLRQYARLERDIVLVGVLDHFEIWSRENWDQENRLFEEALKDEQMRREIARLGL
ncbi:division/cell wall cluster transcriptional repressor MraZ [Thermodesulfobacteriota bacterium]